MPLTWLLLIPSGLAVAALVTGSLAAKLGVALSCAFILFLGCLRTGPREGRATVWVMAALVLSAVGDWFLSNRGGRESYFIAGIGFFFGAHVGFLKYAWRQGQLNRLVLAGLCLVYLAYYVLALRPVIVSPVLAAAVLGYLLISCLALSVACGLRLPLSLKLPFIAGIVLIVFSDTLISFNEFLRWRQWSWLILPTYYLSHICITGSVLVLRCTGRRPKPL
jgi:uncharacterized membrane protein YhhN